MCQCRVNLSSMSRRLYLTPCTPSTLTFDRSLPLRFGGQVKSLRPPMDAGHQGAPLNLLPAISSLL